MSRENEHRSFFGKGGGNSIFNRTRDTDEGGNNSVIQLGLG